VFLSRSGKPTFEAGDRFEVIVWIDLDGDGSTRGDEVEFILVELH
jgi:hypothetical protein